MRNYGKISTSLWRSRKFRSLPDDNARLFYFYLHTCPHVNSVGCFVLPEGYAIADLGWSAEAIGKAIDSLCEASLIAFDRQDEVVRIVDFLRHDPPTNLNHAAGVLKVAMSLPDGHGKLIVLNELRESKYLSDNEALRKAIESLSKAYRNPEPLPIPNPNPIPDPSGFANAQPEPDGSPTPIDARTSLFRDGVKSLMAMTGKPDGACRKLLGGWLRDHGDDASIIHAAINRAAEVRPAEPISFIVAALKQSDDYGDVYRGVL